MWTPKVQASVWCSLLCNTVWHTITNMKLLFPAIWCFVNVFIMLICVIVPRKIRRKFLAGFLTGLYDQSHRCARVRVGRSGLGHVERKTGQDVVMRTWKTLKTEEQRCCMKTHEREMRTERRSTREHREWNLNELTPNVEKADEEKEISQASKVRPGGGYWTHDSIV